MTEQGRAEQRAQESGVEGHSYETDDLIGEFDIYEALVNPHDESRAGQKKGGPGGPGMMPMGQGAGGGAGSAAPVGKTTPGMPAKGTSAASAGASGVGAAGMGSGGFGSAAAGEGGISGAGLSGLGGVGGLGGLGGLSSRMPTGSVPTWSPSSLGTSAAGMDPTTPSYTVPDYGAPTLPGSGIPTLPSPGSSTFPAPTLPAPGAPTIPTPPGSATPAPSIPTLPSGGAGAKPPSVGGAGGGAGVPGGTDAMGNQAVEASPEMLRKEAQAWDQNSQDMGSGVADKVAPLSPSAVAFGMVKDAYPSYNDVLDRVKAWADSAGAEFAAISDALNAAAVGYAETDATNVSATKTISV